MGVTKKNIKPSKAHVEMMEKTKAALKKVSADIIAETKALNSYLVVADSKGNIKKIPAKDL